MPRYKFTLSNQDFPHLKNSLIACSESFQHFCFLDSNNHVNQYSKYGWLCAIDAAHVLSVSENAFGALKEFRSKHNDWLFGHLNYNLKNQVENLSSKHMNISGFSMLEFFVPQHVIFQIGQHVYVESTTLQTREALVSFLHTNQRLSSIATQSVELLPTITKPEYLNTIAELKKELQYGNIYEINFCQEFTATVRDLDTTAVFTKLNESAKAPFSALYKAKNSVLMCASPERYLQKQGDKIVVQPIKGTAKRYANPAKDKEAKSALLASEKERAENVMIVDLMRNDLSRTAKTASVKVEELFGLYSFNAVHQMISTVSSQLHEKYGLENVLHTTFPMGSMTGAPKRSAMQLIDTHENFNRGLYSGSVGYITPEGNADFNVVIRSFIYNALSGYLSVGVGGAITILSKAEAEYEECLLKAEKLFEVLR